ncbi:MAG: BREX system ATP-binding protein BrxD [Methanospirillum sp.]|uniref:BREX system ATP-binding protein BrxD n=1 Tax=Methanospirillum sp. TaxID=45200 RepID=UPI00236CE826|nr:BREX system ATP-binding protein BrxD [Methanospirillum sp.]MDD1729585.1 BREX system ATP-binding protein BrxD [Methanospirillum sp.]
MPAPDRSDASVLESIGIINALRRGTVPAQGLGRFAVGLSVEEEVIADQLDLVSRGGADIKFIRGEYGSGKTFLIARTLEIARKKGFVTAHVAISPVSPLHRLRSLYAQIATSLYAGGEQQAFRSIIDAWLYAIEQRVSAREGVPVPADRLEELTIREVESALSEISLLNAPVAAVIRTYYQANNAADFRTSQAAIGWLCGDPNIGRDLRQKAGIRGDIGDSSIFALLEALPIFVTGAGYQGCVVAIDELEITQTFARNLRERGFQNLVRIIDAIDGGLLPRWYLLCAGTPMLYDGPRGMRPITPLYDRIGQTPIVSEFPNPRQPQILLKPFSPDRLEEVAQRIAIIYEEAYGEVDRGRISHRFIRTMVNRVSTAFGGRIDIIPRLFLKEFVDVLDKCDLYPEYDPMIVYQTNPLDLQELLSEEEKAVMEIRF